MNERPTDPSPEVADMETPGPVGPGQERPNEPADGAADGRTGAGAYPSDPGRATDDLSGPADDFDRLLRPLREYADRHHPGARRTDYGVGDGYYTLVCSGCGEMWSRSKGGCLERVQLLADAAAIEAGRIELARPDARRTSSDETRPAHMPGLSVRDRVVDAIAAEWRRRAADRVEASPEDHARALADAALSVLARVDSAATWGTSCLGCAERLDDLYAERVAGARDALREVAQAGRLLPEGTYTEVEYQHGTEQRTVWVGPWEPAEEGNE